MSQKQVFDFSRQRFFDSTAMGLMTLEQFRGASNRSSQYLRIHPFHTGGWVVLLHSRGLATQRGQLRVFKSMDAVCRFMSDQRQRSFLVMLDVLTPQDCDKSRWQSSQMDCPVGGVQ